MTWSVLKSDKRRDAQTSHLFQPFTNEEWIKYKFASNERVEWFKDLRFGLFIHFGISSVGKVDIGWPRELRKAPDKGKGEIPTEIYDGWVNEFSLEKFDAKEWVNIAQSAGMKYIVVITKHHDGFHLWDTQYSDHKITNYVARRDYIKEVIEACHEFDMPIGLYYSQRDWYHEDYEPVNPRDIEVIDYPPYFRFKEGRKFEITKKHQKYIEYLHHTVRELMTQYGKIDFLWWDASWYDGMFTKEMWDSNSIEEKVRELQPDILINNRASLPGDYDTPEQRIGMFQKGRPWESCMCLGERWAWTDRPVRSLKQVIQQLVQCATGDGNMLLSIGGKPDGGIPRAEAERLLEIGQWLEKYGESIYLTRGGPFLPGTWGGSTYKGKVIYLHILEEREEIILPKILGEIIEVSCLSGEQIKVEQKNEEIRIAILKQPAKSLYTIIKLVLSEYIPDDLLLELNESGAKNIFEKEPQVYGQQLVDLKRIEETIELDKVYRVTGIAISGEQLGKIKLEYSINGRKWDRVGELEVKENKTKYEIPIMRYEAGALIAGEDMRYVRLIKAEGIETLQVYVKD